MFLHYIKLKKKLLFTVIARLIVFVLSFSLIFSPTASYAQSILNLPVPGTMIAPSPAFVPVLLKGMTIHPDDPLKFDFIIDSGNTDFAQDEVEKESERLIKYFLASMTIPKDDLWVNLSPYEQDRIIPEELGKTELGRDMLAQDYILKQLTASLMYPEKELGKKFWDKVYKKAEERFGTSEIPVNTFNKVWILPETAIVYEHEQTVYVVDARLKVMLDSDYEASRYEMSNAESRAVGNAHVRSVQDQNDSLELGESIIREIIVPEIEREVNEGRHFAPLRQIYHSLILAKWYKETVKNSLLSQIYVDKNLTDGVDVADKTIKDKIYAQYMEAYKKGVYNYIKEDYDRLSDEIIPRKYFSGGIPLAGTLEINSIPKVNPISIRSEGNGYIAGVRVRGQKNGTSSPVGDFINIHKEKLSGLGINVKIHSYQKQISLKLKAFITENKVFDDLYWYGIFSMSLQFQRVYIELLKVMFHEQFEGDNGDFPLMRISVEDKPHDGLRLEFMAKGRFLLQDQLSENTWYSSLNSPKAFEAESELSDLDSLFFTLKYVSEYYLDKIAGEYIPIYISWRNITEETDDSTDGFIISVHMPFESPTTLGNSTINILEAGEKIELPSLFIEEINKDIDQTYSSLANVAKHLLSYNKKDKILLQLVNGGFEAVDQLIKAILEHRSERRGSIESLGENTITEAHFRVLTLATFAFIREGRLDDLLVMLREHRKRYPDYYGLLYYRPFLYLQALTKEDPLKFLAIQPEPHWRYDSIAIASLYPNLITGKRLPFKESLPVLAYIRLLKLMKFKGYKKSLTKDDFDFQTAWEEFPDIAQEIARETHGDENYGIELKKEERRALTSSPVLEKLRSYLQSPELLNSSENIEKVVHILNTYSQEGKEILIDFGGGDTKVAYEIARKNKDIGVITFDTYDIPSFQGDWAENFRDKKLTAQTDPLDNLAVIRAEDDTLFELIPPDSVDYILFVAQDWLHERLTHTEVKRSVRIGGQIIVKPYKNFGHFDEEKYTFPEEEHFWGYKFENTNSTYMFGVNIDLMSKYPSGEPLFVWTKESKEEVPVSSADRKSSSPISEELLTQKNKKILFDTKKSLEKHKTSLRNLKKLDTKDAVAVTKLAGKLEKSIPEGKYYKVEDKVAEFLPDAWKFLNEGDDFKIKHQKQVEHIVGNKIIIVKIDTQTESIYGQAVDVEYAIDSKGNKHRGSPWGETLAVGTVVKVEKNIVVDVSEKIEIIQGEKLDKSSSPASQSNDNKYQNNEEIAPQKKKDSPVKAIEASINKYLKQLDNTKLEEREREKAYRQLSELLLKWEVEQLIERLSEGARGVREIVAESLGELGDVRAVDPLIKLLSDEEEDVLIAAAKSLGELGDVRAVDSLIKLLLDEEEDVHIAAAESLGKLGDIRAVDPLTKSLSGEEEGSDFHEALEEALAILGSDNPNESSSPILGGVKEVIFSAELAQKAGYSTPYDLVIKTLRTDHVLGLGLLYAGGAKVLEIPGMPHFVLRKVPYDEGVYRGNVPDEFELIEDPLSDINVGQIVARVKRGLTIHKKQKGTPLKKMVNDFKDFRGKTNFKVYMDEFEKSLKYVASMPQKAYDQLAYDLSRLHENGWDFDQVGKNILIREGLFQRRFGIVDAWKIDGYRNTASLVNMISALTWGTDGKLFYTRDNPEFRQWGSEVIDKSIRAYHKIIENGSFMPLWEMPIVQDSRFDDEYPMEKARSTFKFFGKSQEFSELLEEVENLKKMSDKVFVSPTASESDGKRGLGDENAQLSSPIKDGKVMLEEKILDDFKKAKTKMYNQILEDEGVDKFDSTIALINEYKRMKLPVGLASGSTMARIVLAATNLTNLFDVILDGEDVKELGLKGKPSGDIFRETAGRLGINPANTVVFEDAILGVKAGRDGEFGLVIGIARDIPSQELYDAGAHIVVDDLKGLSVSDIKNSLEKYTANPFAILEGVIFDMDGVVTDTDKVHFKIHKKILDDFLRSYQQGIVKFEEFTFKEHHSYLTGRPIKEGFRDFLESRGFVFQRKGTAPDSPADDKSGSPMLAGGKEIYKAEFIERTQRLLEEAIDSFNEDVSKRGIIWDQRYIYELARSLEKEEMSESDIREAFYWESQEFQRKFSNSSRPSEDERKIIKEAVEVLRQYFDRHGLSFQDFSSDIYFRYPYSGEEFTGEMFPHTRKILMNPIKLNLKGIVHEAVHYNFKDVPVPWLREGLTEYITVMALFEAGYEEIKDEVFVGHEKETRARFIPRFFKYGPVTQWFLQQDTPDAYGAFATLAEYFVEQILPHNNVNFDEFLNEFQDGNLPFIIQLFGGEENFIKIEDFGEVIGLTTFAPELVYGPDLERGIQLLSSLFSSPIINDPGGIDMNDIDVDRQGGSVDIQFNPVEIQEIIDMGITGFAPVIINFTPLPSVLPLLGLEPRKEEEYELSQLTPIN